MTIRIPIRNLILYQKYKQGSLQNPVFFKLFFYLLMTVFLFSCSDGGLKKSSGVENKYYSEILDSIKANKFSENLKKQVLSELYNDSLENVLFSQLAYSYYKQEDSAQFRFWNSKNMKLSQVIGDTAAIAEANWDLANFFYQHRLLDSSYLHYNRAHKYYELDENKFMAGRMLLNLATIQSDIRDYAGSEVNTVRAIKKFKPLRKDKQLYMSYNNLGIIYNELGDYEMSINYHSEALEYSEALNDPLKTAASYNNLGVALKNKKLYNLADNNLNKALETDSLYYKDPELYAMLLDNLAHTRLLKGDTSGVKAQLYKALNIRDSLSFISGVTVNKLHIAEFLLQQDDTLGAIQHSKDAKTLASSGNNFRDELQANLFLSAIDKKNSSKYYLDYIRLNDSLIRVERAVRNKFERIRFETDEYIARNSELSTQRNWIIAGSTGTVLLFSLLLVIRNQKAKNKKLQFEQKQNKANEEIYNLLLEQEKKREEGSRNEKMRISRELHDGVLGRLFGVRFVLGSHYEQSGESRDIKEKYLGELKSIEEEIRRISHDLQHNHGIKEVGFLQLIRNLLQDNENILLVKGELITDENIEWQKIPYKIKMNLYRIIQEALLNSAKHGKATKFTVNFQSKARNILLRISDNGCGFDLTKTTEGIGLSNMKDRVLDCKGNIDINSTESGTEIEIIIPV
ncbi:sensor histidine kinase [Salinimicrobium sp. MT39]|uniref:histidine kinase n=1 Tax=Salinimicrobium profundisediminis TaxID=2994553 RepID=A0A9X3CZ56_9FLAO|nr:sensor histidine kinase [Salinimicrobium profundisediminis]MCX2839428.1 sensor histidine kinase [Salinimicrobium profundisediminis]